QTLSCTVTVPAGATAANMQILANATPSPNWLVTDDWSLREDDGTTPPAGNRVYASGKYLYDQNGRWKINGVQFILPDRGINGLTFVPGNYQASVRDGSVEYWLAKAQDYLLAKSLRIFVDMPGARSPSDAETIYDFATRASARGMRLG